MTATPARRVVVDDTDPDSTLTLDRAPDGSLFTPETAARYAAALNESRKPQYRTWQVFALVPTAPDGAAKSDGQDLDAGAFARDWTAARAAATLSGDATMVLFEPEGSEPGTETWAITSVSYEEDLAGAVVIRGRLLPGPDAMESGPGAGGAPSPQGKL